MVGRSKPLPNKNPSIFIFIFINRKLLIFIIAPGPGAYNSAYTDFGGLHDYNKTKSFDARATRTYHDSVKKTTFQTNTNENHNYYTTGFKQDFLDFNKNTVENRKQLKEGLDEGEDLQKEV